MYISIYPCLSCFLTGRRPIFENMYLGDSGVVLNTLGWCCHRKIWLHSGEACFCCGTAPPRLWDECQARAGTPWIDTQQSSNLGMEPMVPSCWEEALSRGNWLLLKSKCCLSLSWIHPQLHLVNVALTLPSPFPVFGKRSEAVWVEGMKKSLRQLISVARWLLTQEPDVRGLTHIPTWIYYFACSTRTLSKHLLTMWGKSKQVKKHFIGKEMETLRN